MCFMTLNLISCLLPLLHPILTRIYPSEEIRNRQKRLMLLLLPDLFRRQRRLKPNSLSCLLTADLRTCFSLSLFHASSLYSPEDTCGLGPPRPSASVAPDLHWTRMNLYWFFFIFFPPSKGQKMLTTAKRHLCHPSPGFHRFLWMFLMPLWHQNMRV